MCFINVMWVCNVMACPLILIHICNLWVPCICPSCMTDRCVLTLFLPVSIFLPHPIFVSAGMFSSMSPCHLFCLSVTVLTYLRHLWVYCQLVTTMKNLYWLVVKNLSVVSLIQQIQWQSKQWLEAHNVIYLFFIVVLYEVYKHRVTTINSCHEDVLRHSSMFCKLQF